MADCTIITVIKMAANETPDKDFDRAVKSSMKRNKKALDLLSRM